MIANIFIILSSIFINNEKEIFLFNSSETSGEWRVINDEVMGGISQSTFNITEDGNAEFKGTLSPDNNGGFASARAYIEEYDVNEFDGVMIKVTGDGNIYNLRFRTNKNYDGISYHAKFNSDSDVWREVRIPFEEFKPTFRGRIVSDQPDLKSNSIRQVGILIADNQFGEFELKIKWIKFYKN